jgi:hypothetical protein
MYIYKQSRFLDVHKSGKVYSKWIYGCKNKGANLIKSDKREACTKHEVSKMWYCLFWAWISTPTVVWLRMCLIE